MSSANGGNGGQVSPVRDPETDKARLRAIHASLTAGDIACRGQARRGCARRRHRPSDGAQPRCRPARGGRAVRGSAGAAAARQGRGAGGDRDHQRDRALPDLARAASRGGRGIRCGAGAGPAFAPALRQSRHGAWWRSAGWSRRGADYEAARALDPGNLIALNGLAALALRRGDAGRGAAAGGAGDRAPARLPRGADHAGRSRHRRGQARRRRRRALRVLLADARVGRRSTGRSPSGCSATRSTLRAASPRRSRPMRNATGCGRSITRRIFGRGRHARPGSRR